MVMFFEFIGKATLILWAFLCSVFEIDRSIKWTREMCGLWPEMAASWLSCMIIGFVILTSAQGTTGLARLVILTVGGLMFFAAIIPFHYLVQRWQEHEIQKTITQLNSDDSLAP